MKKSLFKLSIVTVCVVLIIEGRPGPSARELENRLISPLL